MPDDLEACEGRNRGSGSILNSRPASCLGFWTMMNLSSLDAFQTASREFTNMGVSDGLASITATFYDRLWADNDVCTEDLEEFLSIDCEIHESKAVWHLINKLSSFGEDSLS